MKAPLEGIRVLDLAALLPGHYGTQLLADMGADVIKVERIGGDVARHLLPGTFEAVNRNKRSIALDLKNEAGKAVFYRLVASADGIVEGFRPGVAERVGIDYETCSKINPRIVYVSISGFGQDGPYRLWSGHDINYVGVAGHLGVGPLDDANIPEVAATPVSDYGAGMFAALALLTALRGRDLNGVGQYIDFSMTDGMVSWMSTIVEGHQFTGETPLLTSKGQAHYGIFRCRDGKYLTLGALEDAFWQNLCRVMGRNDWASDPRFATLTERNRLRDEIHPHVTRFIAERDREELLRVFNANDVPSAPLNAVAELANDPQIAHREMFFEMSHPTFGAIKQVGHPAKYRGTPAQYRLAPPLVGQHTVELLKSLGYGQTEVAALIASGAVQALEA